MPQNFSYLLARYHILHPLLIIGFQWKVDDANLTNQHNFYVIKANLWSSVTVDHRCPGLIKKVQVSSTGSKQEGGKFLGHSQYSLDALGHLGCYRNDYATVNGERSFYIKMYSKESLCFIFILLILSKYILDSFFLKYQKQSNTYTFVLQILLILTHQIQPCNHYQDPGENMTSIPDSSLVLPNHYSHVEKQTNKHEANF